MASKVKRKKVWIGWVGKDVKVQNVIACNKAIYGCFYLPQNIYFIEHSAWKNPISKKVRITVEEIHQSQGRQSRGE